MGHAREPALLPAKANVLAAPHVDMAYLGLDLDGAELVHASGPSSHLGGVYIAEVSHPSK